MGGNTENDLREAVQVLTFIVWSFLAATGVGIIIRDFVFDTMYDAREYRNTGPEVEKRLEELEQEVRALNGDQGETQ